MYVPASSPPFLEEYSDSLEALPSKSLLTSHWGKLSDMVHWLQGSLSFESFKLGMWPGGMTHCMFVNEVTRENGYWLDSYEQLPQTLGSNH